MKTLLDRITAIQDLRAAQNLAAWDQDCHMPKGGGDARASMASTLEREVHRKLTDPALRDAAQEVAQSADVLERTIGERWLKEHVDALAVPESLAAGLAEASSRGCSAWYDATTFEEVLPALDQLVKLNREYAACFPAMKPYDALIDCFEPGMTQDSINRSFDVLRPALLNLREKATPASTTHEAKTTEAQILSLCKIVTASLGLDYRRANLTTTEHPFMVSLSRSDVRIATRLTLNDPLFTLTSAIHEAGHAMYEQGTGYVGTGLDSLDSSALHESQSLFYEIMVGKSERFWKQWLPALNSVISAPFQDVSTVIASLRSYDPTNVTRLQAGDLDYGLHILLRYDLERALFSGQIEAKDMRDTFNDLCKSYFGRTPKEDRREGVLQDVHWPAGMFGYFPSYLLGVAFAAQLWTRCEIEDAQNDPLDTLWFLQRTVHTHGGRYTFEELTSQMGGFDPTFYISYLKRAYDL